MKQVVTNTDPARLTQPLRRLVVGIVHEKTSCAGCFLFLDVDTWYLSVYFEKEFIKSKFLYV